MALNTKDFVTLVREQTAVIQGKAASLIDFSIGSVLRAMVESNSAVAMWFQGLILALLAKTRAATSSGADLDTWVNDFGVTRLPAVAATGSVTFSRFTPTNPAIVPINAKVQSADGSLQYTVTIDAANPAYSAAQGGYVLGAGIASVTVPVQAITAGSASNAAIGQISTMAQAISGVDTVTNAAALTNGEEAETDAELRTRFVSYIASLAKATYGAVVYAITSIKQGITYTLTENQDYSGATKYGYFYAVVDDGSGAPSTTFTDSVYLAIDAVRPFTVVLGVFAPSVVTATVGMTITTLAGYDPAATALLVKNAITNYINTLPLGTPLRYTRLAQIAYEASDGVSNVSGVLLNAGTSDLVITNKQIVKASTITVS